MDTIKNDLYTRKLAEKWNFIRKFAAENTYRNMIYCISKRMEIAAAQHGYLDHGYLNDLIDRNPTAENIAQWIVERIPQCYKAVVQESEGNTAMAVDERKIAGKESLVL